MAGARLNIMTKRVITACILVTMLFTTVLCFPAHGAITDPPAADVVIDCDVVAVTPGSLVTVDVYLTNITRPNGILTCDIPFYYDAEYLEFITVEGLFPSYWNGYGEYVGNSEHSETPINGFIYLRAMPEAPDLELSPNSRYNVKGDRDLGFRVSFIANKEGETTFEVKTVGNTNILVVDSQNLSNYRANPTSFTLTISSDKNKVEELNKGDTSSEVSDDTSSEVSDDTSDISSEDPGESSEISNYESYESEESSDVSADESSDISTDASAESSEESEDESLSVTVSDDESAEYSKPDIEDDSDASGDDSSVSSSDNDRDSDDGDNTLLIILIVVGGLALVGAAVAVVFMLKSKKK